jgi:hypothetical protein
MILVPMHSKLLVVHPKPTTTKNSLLNPFILCDHRFSNIDSHSLFRRRAFWNE